MDYISSVFGKEVSLLKIIYFDILRLCRQMAKAIGVQFFTILTKFPRMLISTLKTDLFSN